MKTIGLIGGMSWESTAKYYEIINKMIQKNLGKHYSCECILYSVNFNTVYTLQLQNKWEELAQMFIKISNQLAQSGATCIVICANTPHKVAKRVQEKIDIPLLDIVDATAEAIQEKKISKIGLLGTIFTMEENFYKTKLLQEYNLDIITPNKSDRITVDDIIYNELTKGKYTEDSKQEINRIIDKLIARGAEGIILGCTELPLLIHEKKNTILFNTTKLHALKAVKFSLNNNI